MRRLIVAAAVAAATPALAGSLMPAAEYADRQLPDPRQERQAKARGQQGPARPAVPEVGGRSDLVVREPGERAHEHAGPGRKGGPAQPHGHGAHRGAQ